MKRERVERERKMLAKTLRRPHDPRPRTHACACTPAVCRGRHTPLSAARHMHPPAGRAAAAASPSTSAPPPALASMRRLVAAAAAAAGSRAGLAGPPMSSLTPTRTIPARTTTSAPTPPLADAPPDSSPKKKRASRSAAPLPATRLVIVESPAKAKKIAGYLGPGATVLATYGHVRDLPARAGSVSPEAGFAMAWEPSARAGPALAAISAAASRASEVILATDPDREGEAISWHVWEELKVRKRIPAPDPNLPTSLALAHFSSILHFRTAAPSRRGRPSAAPPSPPSLKAPCWRL